MPKPVESSNLCLSNTIIRAMSDYICRMVGEASGVVGDHPVAASCSSGCEAEIHDKLDRDRQVDLADIGLRFAKRAGTSYADIRIWNKLIGVPWKIMFTGPRDWVYRS